MYGYYHNVIESFLKILRGRERQCQGRQVRERRQVRESVPEFTVIIVIRRLHQKRFPDRI